MFKNRTMMVGRPIMS